MIDVVRLVLAGVFAVAGFAKLADLEGSRSAVAGFGVRKPLARPLGLALPLAELAIAGGLLFAASARYAAAAAAVLLAVFCAVIGAALARRRKPDCHCFGRLHSAPAGWGTLARNLTLAIVATALVLRPGTTPARLHVGIAALVVAGGAQAILWVVLLRRYGKALHRVEELESAPKSEPVSLGEGDLAPAFAARALDGRLVTLHELLALQRKVLLVFVRPGCGPCNALLPEIAEWQPTFADRLTVAVVSSGSAEENRLLLEHPGLHSLVAQDAGELLDLYGVSATPAAIAIESDGRISAPAVAGAGAIRELLQRPAGDATSLESAPRGPARETAVAAAAAAAVAAPLAQGATARREAADDPELQAFRKVLENASPGLARASRRSAAAVRAATIFQGNSRERARKAAAARPAAVKALEAERTAVVALRKRLAGLPATTPRAYNAKTTGVAGLQLVARSLEVRKKAVLAAPKTAAKLATQAERLFLRALDSIALSARLLAGE